MNEQRTDQLEIIFSVEKKTSSVEINIFDIELVVKSCLEFFVLKSYVPFHS